MLPFVESCSPAGRLDRTSGPCEPAPTSLTADVAVVGGGPVGCVAALAFARSGAHVCLIDPDTPSGRLTGEWLHPTGAGILEELRVDLTGVEHSLGCGFAIFPKGAEPIVLVVPATVTSAMQFQLSALSFTTMLMCVGLLPATVTSGSPVIVMSWLIVKIVSSGDHKL